MTKAAIAEQVSIWNNNSPLQETKDRLWTALVPHRGACFTMHGELLRSVIRIYHDRNNNGFGNGPFHQQDKIIRNHSEALIEFMDWDDLKAFWHEFSYMKLGEKVLQSKKWDGDEFLEKLVDATILAVEKIDSTYDGYRMVSELIADVQSSEQAKREKALQIAKEKMNSWNMDADLIKELAIASLTALSKVASLD